jgi:hypothetical protein
LDTVIADFNEVLWTASLDLVIIPRWIWRGNVDLGEDSTKAKSEDDSLSKGHGMDFEIQIIIK